ncbi:hypothetical protein GJAV_G00149660 [Gymnothorax javanicus]|nr:hypothetical protein GJAV_G00149660 [Gymnothorax javanicus]
MSKLPCISDSLSRLATNLRLSFSVEQEYGYRRQAMPEVKSIFREVLPKQGQLSIEDVPTMVLCKPKLLPLKSVTLEKLEKMQQEAQEAIRQQELAQKHKPESLSDQNPIEHGFS